jgi:hypothetical protein
MRDDGRMMSIATGSGIVAEGVVVPVGHRDPHGDDAVDVLRHAAARDS